MSLVGTRPILPDELEQYELHHRARIAIKPGITGMWQVSGRSDITDFEEIVRLDATDLLRFYGGDIREKTEDGIMTRFKRLHREKNLCGFSHYIVDRCRKTHKTYWKNCKKRL